MSNVNSMIEARFDIDELFFSITDLDSKILACNDTFVRVSEYSIDEIVGSYHNFVRHEDMPKVVFKTFWDYLKDNKPVVAYVKNRTKTGAYYWVMAAVFPVEETYVSIRIKPTSELLNKAQSIYALLAQHQETNSMHEQEALLYSELKNAGYRNYDHFMNDVLLTELTLRNNTIKTLNKESKKSTCQEEHAATGIALLNEMSQSLECEVHQWFDKIKQFDEVKTMFETKSHHLRILARDMVLLSLNASVASYKLEANGETFGVLASDIRSNAKKNTHSIEKLYNAANTMAQSLEKMIFLVSYLSLQVQMSSYFINELNLDSNAQLNSSVDILTQLVQEHYIELLDLPQNLQEVVEDIVQLLDYIEQQVMYLGYVQIYGIIESSRCSDDKLGFTGIFNQLKALIATTTDEISTMRKSSALFAQDTKQFLTNLYRVQNKLDTFLNEIDRVKRT